MHASRVTHSGLREEEVTVTSDLSSSSVTEESQTQWAFKPDQTVFTLANGETVRGRDNSVILTPEIALLPDASDQEKRVVRGISNSISKGLAAAGPGPSPGTVTE